jgi:N-acyl-D-amino-acid deacylase
MEEYGYGLFHAPRGEVISGRYHGLLEAIEISQKANNIPLLIAHFTPAYKIPQPHPESLQKAVAEATLSEIVDKALGEGIKVHYNVIACQYSIGSQEPMISSFFSRRLVRPDWLKELSKEEFVQNLRDGEFRKRVKDFMYSGRFKVGMLHPLSDPYWMDCYKIVTCKNKDYEGRVFGEICRERSPNSIINAVYHESVETLFDILVEDPDTTWALVLDKREYPGAIPVFLKHPSGMPCIDSGVVPAKIKGDFKPAPIYYGLFPLYIDTYVKQKGTLTLEEAIKKATFVPAQEVLGLRDRGIIQEGAYADIVVFDLETIKMTGDYVNPSSPPDGIEYVLVNGKIVYQDKKHTGERSGKVLRHTPSI